MTAEFSSRRLLDELDFPVCQYRQLYVDLQDRFVAVVDPAFRLVMGTRRDFSGEAPFAVLQLLARALNDVICAFHLAVHGYLNQAYGVMRMAYEASDIVELVARDPIEGRRWVETQVGHRDFAPGRVRERLGADRFDPFYSQLSEMAHPRFDAARLTAYARRNIGQPSADPQIVLRIGPFLVDEHPAVLFALMMLSTVAARVVVRTSALALVSAVTEEEWEHQLSAFRVAHEAFLSRLVSALAEHGVDASELLAPSLDDCSA